MQRSKILLLAIGLALAAGGFGLSMQGSDDMKVLGNFTYRIANVVFFAWIIWHFFGDKLGAFFKGRSGVYIRNRPVKTCVSRKGL